MDDVLNTIREVKKVSANLSLMRDKERNAVLHSLASILRTSADVIMAENAKDLANMDKTNPLYDRLLLNEARIKAMADDIEKVITLPSPLSKELLNTTMPNGLQIKKITVSLGVVAIIYESRPNVTIDVFTLCFKSGNACILKGGKEAYHSNFILVRLIEDVLKQHHVDNRAIYLFPPHREQTNILLNAVGLVDVCIPRGSQALIDFVRQNAKIPVIETGAGIVHTYFDKQADLNKGSLIIHNAKTRRVGVCNALDCLLVHQDRVSDLYALIKPLEKENVEIYADLSAYQALEAHYPKSLLRHAKPEDFGREFLDYKMAIKVVDSLEVAVATIVTHTSGHSEAIITEDHQAASYFIERIDAAVVYVNTSTAFTDGGQFGMGAEIGISTQKLHARGPMGLEALTSYKWVVYGDGQIRKP